MRLGPAKFPMPSMNFKPRKARPIKERRRYPRVPFIERIGADDKVEKVPFTEQYVRDYFKLNSHHGEGKILGKYQTVAFVPCEYIINGRVVLI